MGKNLFIHGQVGTAGRVNGFLCQDHDVFDGSQHVLRDHQRGPDAHVLGGDPCDIRVCGETGDASDSGSTNSLRTAETPIPDSKSENLKKPQISGVYRCSAHFNNSSGSLDSEQSPNGESSQVNPHCSLRREPTPSAADALSFLHANVRSYRYKVAELTRIVERSNFPTYVAFTETWLDRSFESIKLPGYVEVSRRDRGTSAHGGVILFAKAGFENTIVHLGNSAVAERSWHVVHSNCGPLLLGVWYRRPCHAEVVSIESLDREIQEYGRDTMGTILFGDMNVHEVSWLKHSDGTSIEGRALRDVACSHGWEERVRKPTRGDYLLDLVLTDLGTAVKTKVLAGVSDHRIVLGTVDVAVRGQEATSREVFDFGKASWANIRKRFRDEDWDGIFSDLGVDTAAKVFEDNILSVLREFVPTKTVTNIVSSHPWLNQRCRDAIDKKLDAVGTVQELPARDACSRILLEEHDKYLDRTRKQLSKMPGSSRGWWRLSNALAGKRTKTSGVQPLKRDATTWARSASEKAQLLADTFAEKSVLPPEVSNEHSTIGDAVFAPDYFLPIRTRDVRRVLRKLKVDSSTGPDGIATMVLRTCAVELAYPLAILIRRMVSSCRWPDVWREHWVVPLFKKKSRADPNNYRGVHLTPQLSKAAERVVGKLFQRFLEKSGAYGDRQFAYGKGKGVRDALALSVLSWLLAMEFGNVVGLYCSDVSGAFDRVCAKRLADKLATLHLHPKIHGLLVSWLAPRVSKVAVEGKFSAATPLTNSVFQGTVWGPPLWNCFYADASKAVAKNDFLDIVFADDLNCTKIFPNSKSNDDILLEGKKCQKELHAWGAANRVSFDPGKESLHVLHRSRGQGGNFKILGVTYDTALVMHDACRELAVEAGWRLKSLIRSRKFHTTKEMFRLYKAEILSFIESRTAGIHHAAVSNLACIDRVQRRFLSEMSTSEHEALTKWNLAPLSCRRHIAMLGLLHRVAWRRAPAALCDLFALKPPVEFYGQLRGLSRRHQWQFLEPIQLVGSRYTDVFARSVFGLVTVWNMLPADLVSCSSVKTFQKRLRLAVVKRAQSSTEFVDFFSDAKRMTVPVFQRFFGA